QTRPQALIAVAPPLPARRIAATAGYLGQARITSTVIRPGVTRGAGTVTVVVARRVHEIPRADPCDVMPLRVIQLGTSHEQLGAGRAVTVIRKVRYLLGQ